MYQKHEFFLLNHTRIKIEDATNLLFIIESLNMYHLNIMNIQSHHTGHTLRLCKLIWIYTGHTITLRLCKLIWIYTGHTITLRLVFPMHRSRHCFFVFYCVFAPHEEQNITAPLTRMFHFARFCLDVTLCKSLFYIN